MRRIQSFCTIACLIPMFWASCKHSEEPGPMTARSRVVPDHLIGKVKAEAYQRFAHNQSASCERQVLRGEPLPGKAFADQYAVQECAEDTKPCLDLHRALSRDDVTLLDKFVVRPAEVQNRYWGMSPLPKSSSKMDETVLGVVETCRPLIARIQRAVRHVDSCSLYLPGTNCNNTHQTQLWALRSLAASALAAAADGDDKRALEMILDGLRFSQDMVRGGVGLLAASASAAAASQTAPVLEAILNRKEPLPEELLNSVLGQLETLLNSEAHPSAMLQGEYLTTVAASLTQELYPDEKNLIGDVCFEPFPKWKVFETRSPVGADARDAANLYWLVLDRCFSEYFAACPPSLSPSECQHGLKKCEKKNNTSNSAPGDFAEQISDLVGTAGAEVSGKTLDTIIDLARFACPQHSIFIGLHGTRPFIIAAARLHAAYRLEADRNKRCPGIEAFDEPPLSQLRVDPFTKEPLKVTVEGTSTFVIEPPKPMFDEQPYRRVWITIRCHLAD